MSATSTARRLLLLLAGLALPLTLLPVAAPQAGADERLDFDTLVAEVTRHTETGPDGLPVFDAEAAEAAGAAPEVLQAGAQMPAAAQMLADEPEDGDVSTLDGIPVWGNWCGPGHGSGAPVDTLDTLCMRHDLCYRERGYFDCLCDAQLKAEIDRYAERMTGGERAMAAAVKTAFSVGICIP